MIEVLRANITTLALDAIVNAASETFRGGGGVDGAIHAAAGPELLAECRRYARLPTGEAIVTKGYRLPARCIIHTVGPIWTGGSAGEPELLRRAYQSVFAAALAEGSIRTIAFPSISTGVYGFPKGDAARIALDVMRAYDARFDRIVVCAFSAADEETYASLMSC